MKIRDTASIRPQCRCEASATLISLLLVVVWLSIPGCHHAGKDDGACSDTVDLDGADGDVGDAADAEADTPDMEDGEDADIAPCVPSTSRQLTEQGLRITDECGTELVLSPWLMLDGEHVDVLQDGTCTLTGALECTLEQGTVRLFQEDDTTWLELEATGQHTVEGLELAGGGTLPGARGWLSNGFQSWSMSGVVSIEPAPSSEALQEALTVRGDNEVLRQGTHQLSWFHSWIGGGDASLIVAAQTSARWKPWVQVSRVEPGADLRIRVVSGGAGERVALQEGETAQSERWTIALTHEGTTGLNQGLEAWAATLGPGVGVAADAGWNSWYELWDTVDEAAVRANASTAAETLTPLLAQDAPPLRIVVDDGWQVMWGEWQPNEKFPSGLDGLSADLHDDGFEMGVWLAPLLVDEDSQLVADNPDWFVPDLVYNHPKNGAMRVLDPTHPGAAAHLQSVIETIVGWNYGLLKIDFLFAGAWEGDRYEDVTGMEAYHRALEIIRSAAGDDVVLLAVGAPGLPSIPHVDSWRIGWDIALEPFDVSYPFIVDQARSVSARWPLCRAVLCDADPPLLRELPENEVRMGIQVAALTGGAFFLSDDLRDLPASRLMWLDAETVGRGASGQTAVPLVAFPDSPDSDLVNGGIAHVLGYTEAWVPPVWQLQDGSRILFNTGEVEDTIEGQSVPARSVLLLP